jgi:IclR family pca regulon transcriptional regulator
VSGDEQRRGEGNDNAGEAAFAEDSGRAPASFPTLGGRRYSRALGGGLAILSCFTPERPVLGTTEIAEEIDMSVTTTSRFVMTLVDQGFLERAEASRKYQLTLQATELGMASLNETALCTYARPHLERLAKRARYTVALGVLDGSEVLVVDHIAGDRRRQREVGDDVRAGTRLPAYCTSMGKLLLAHLPREQKSRLISEMDLERLASKTITSKELLAAQLQQVLDGGLAVDDEECVPGTCAIAAPVRDQSGDVVAAVSLVVLGGAMELEELIHRFMGDLKAGTERISASLGWSKAGE